MASDGHEDGEEKPWRNHKKSIFLDELEEFIKDSSRDPEKMKVFLAELKDYRTNDSTDMISPHWWKVFKDEHLALRHPEFENVGEDEIDKYMKPILSGKDYGMDDYYTYRAEQFHHFTAVTSLCSSIRILIRLSESEKHGKTAIKRRYEKKSTPIRKGNMTDGVDEYSIIPNQGHSHSATTESDISDSDSDELDSKGQGGLDLDQFPDGLSMPLSLVKMDEALRADDPDEERRQRAAEFRCIANFLKIKQQTMCYDADEEEDAKADDLEVDASNVEVQTTPPHN